MIKTLYHYCSIDTLLKILQNKTIRISDVRKMNDYAERRWIYQEFITCFNGKDFIDRIALDKQEKVKIAIKHVTGCWESYLLPGGAYPEYVFCLSGNGDVLSHWRGYGDDGCGVAIGFNKATLDRLLSDENPCFRITQIDYEGKQKIKLVAEKIISEINQSEINNEIDLDEFFINRMRCDSVTMKNPAFSEENEWRLIFSPNECKTPENEFSLNNFHIENLSHRPHRKKFVGFRDIDFSYYVEEIINDIYLGPKCKIDPLTDMPEILYHNGFDSTVLVQKSSATYE